MKLADLANSLESSKDLDAFYQSISSEKKQLNPNRSVLSYFYEQVVKYPDKIAVIYEEKCLSYSELNKKSDILAEYLISQGVEDEEIVGIYLDRSVEYIVSIFAILKVSAAYLPLNTKFPRERLNFICDDASVRYVISGSGKERFQPELKYIEIDTINLENKKASEVKLPKRSLNKLMYVIYTSGSTGKPKGVMLEEKGLVSLVKYSDQIVYSEEDCVLQTVEFSFDPSVMEIFGALLNGATLYIVNDSLLYDQEQLTHYVRLNNISHVTFITPLFERYIETNPDLFESINTVMFGGEKVNLQKVNSFLTKYPGKKLINCYGPTESSIVATTNNYSDEIGFDSIGKAIDNTEVFIMDEQNKLLGKNILGELCLGGEGISRSYINRPDIDEDRFIPHPYDQKKKIYKSGDLAIIKENGWIEFKGRKDKQVKINGFRIELDEISEVLLTLNDIQSAVTMAIDKSIVSFLCTDSDHERIYNRLLSRLPDYMLPKDLIILEEIPLTVNRKVNYQQLEDIYRKKYENIDEIVQPENEIELTILNIWKRVLSKEEISTNVDFFVAGGSSLDVITVNSKLQTEFPGLVVATDLFSKTTIKSLASFIKGKLDTEKLEETKFEEF